MTMQKIPNTDLSVSGFCYGVMHFGAMARGGDMLDLYHQFRAAGATSSTRLIATHAGFPILGSMNRGRLLEALAAEDIYLTSERRD